MSIFKAQATLIALVAVAGTFTSCENQPDSDQKQTVQQEQMLMDATNTVGMPAIKNYRERKLLKQILEQRDQANFSTFTYLVNMNGRLIFLCSSIGYGLPYATQFTSPQKLVRACLSNCNYVTMPQADPNGLFSPPQADGTWVLCKDPKGPDVKPVYVEPRIVVSPFELKADYAGRD